MKIVRYGLAGLMLLAGAAQHLQAQDKDPALVRTFKGHSKAVFSVAFSPDGRLALSGSSDNTLKLWETASGRLVRTFRGHSKAVFSVAFSPDGRQALSGSYDNTLKLWETTSGRLVRTFEGHTNWVWSVAFSPDGRYALSGSEDKTIKLWEISSGREIRTFKGHAAAIIAVAFSPDGRYALSGSGHPENALKLWEISNGRELRTFKGHSSWVYSVAFSPDGRYALSGSQDNTLKLWEISSGREIRTFKGHAAAIISVAFSPDGQYALSGSGDETLKLWDTASGRLVRTFKGHTNTVRSVAFSPDDRQALSGSYDNTLKLWDISPWTMPDETPLAETDRTPPAIRITSPTITRGMKKVQQEKTILVKGRATDASGIFEVLVDGMEAQLDADGSFWAEVKLRVGENHIVVKATDMHDNAASTAFTIVREAGGRPAPVGAARTREQEEFQFGEYHALLIAVQDYSDRSINDLDYPIEDAERIRGVLLEQYTFKKENIHFLKNPSRRDILKKLGELRSLDEDDNLLIYYAGHGYWDEKAGQGYWLPRDARQDDDSDWISNSDIKVKIRSIETRHTLLISDACFSGGIFKTREAFIKPNISIQKVYEMPSRKALTSGNLKTVPDKSVFVDYLVKRLRQNREPYLYSEKLYVNMKDAVTNNSPNNQTPLFGVINGAGDEGGDFIFVRKR